MTTEVNETEAAPLAAQATPANKPTRKPAKVAASTGGVEGVYALCRITYGKAQSAVPGDLFAPVSEAERDSLFAMGAVRELSDAEQALFEKTRAASDEMFG